MGEIRVRSLGWEEPLEKEMATHSSTTAWKILWTEEPGRLQSMGSQRLGHDWATSLHFTSLHFALRMGLLGGASDKEPACQCRRHKRLGFYPWMGKIPWRRAWQPTPGFLPGESHWQRSLVGYSPWNHTESDTTEWLSTYTPRILLWSPILGLCPPTCTFCLNVSIVDEHWYVNFWGRAKWHIYIYIYTHTFFFKIFFSIMVYHRILNIVLYAIQ